MQRGQDPGSHPREEGVSPQQSSPPVSTCHTCRETFNDQLTALFRWQYTCQGLQKEVEEKKGCFLKRIYALKNDQYVLGTFFLLLLLVKSVFTCRSM